MSGSRFAARFLAVVLLGAGLGACGGASPLDTYDLAAPRMGDLAAPRTTGAARAGGRQVLVADPVVDRALDTDRIVVRPKPTEIAYFAGAQWSDRLPRLLQSRLVETLEASGRVRAAGRPGQGMAADGQIVMEIRAFDYLPSEARVRVAIAVKTMDDRSGRIAAMRLFEASEAVSGDSAPAVVAGFDAAAGRVLADIAAWVK